MGSENGEKYAEKGTALDEQMNQVVSLVEARLRGQVGNQEVESAISGLLSSTRPPRAVNRVQEDIDDYDNLEDEITCVPSKPSSLAESSQRRPLPELTVASMRKEEDRDEVDPLDEIPLGKEGARMMVTFGDGHNPKPDAVCAALLGARLCLQVAIKDARALRRHEKDEYLRARVRVKLGKDKKAKLGPHDHKQDHVDPNMLYRAMAGYDRLAYDPPCGFDIDQLKMLFPEEMNAYNRWNQMHRAYEASSKDDGTTAPESTGDTAVEPEADEHGNAVGAESGVPKGHLEQRAAQFDARTDQMKKDWYLKFSEVRQGSFLPRRKGKQSIDEKEWDASRTKVERGRRKETGTWEHKAAATVKFLHWVGFDPQSTLPPPSDEIASALAFLAYDFLGKIVEKAIYLRNSRILGETEGDFLLELRDGEQLKAEDIEQALNDTDIQPLSLYNAQNSSSGTAKHLAAQLYFGPGFEDRLEMELEELVAGTKKRKALSEDELNTRKREDALFAKIAEAPTVWTQRSTKSVSAGSDAGVTSKATEAPPAI